MSYFVFTLISWLRNTSLEAAFPWTLKGQLTQKNLESSNSENVGEKDARKVTWKL
jgi:hypothetical protein